MSPSKNPASGAPARQQQPASSTTPSKKQSQQPASRPDADKAEPVKHKRPPVRSDDN